MAEIKSWTAPSGSSIPSAPWWPYPTVNPHDTEVATRALEPNGERGDQPIRGRPRPACADDQVDYRLRTGKNEGVPVTVRRASGEALCSFHSSQAPPGREPCADASAPTATSTGTTAVGPSPLDNPHSTSLSRTLRTFTALLLAAVMTFTVTACGPDRGLKVSPEGNPSPSLFAPNTEAAGEPNEPFSLDEVRKAIESSSGNAVTGSVTETAEVIADCKDCLKFSSPFLSGEQKFQLVTVANPKQRDETIAGAVVSEYRGEPRLELIATGNQLKVDPGRNGTLVVQEAMFADGDKACCPSGWSVQVYRLHDGRFEPGQRFTRLNGET